MFKYMVVSHLNDMCVRQNVFFIVTPSEKKGAVEEGNTHIRVLLAIKIN